MKMFLIGLLVIFVLIPAVLIVGTVLIPLTTRFWIPFVLFPVALIAFTLWRHLSGDGAPGAAHDGGDR